MVVLKDIARKLIFHGVAVTANGVLVNGLLEGFRVYNLQNSACLLYLKDLIVISHIFLMKIIRILRGYQLIRGAVSFSSEV